MKEHTPEQIAADYCAITYGWQHTQERRQRLFFESYYRILTPEEVKELDRLNFLAAQKIKLNQDLAFERKK